MRQAHTVEEIRAAEECLRARLPEGALMQQAATGLAYAVAGLLRERTGGVYGRRVVLLVGAGDNGGDALYAGARLARLGASIEARLLSDRAHAGGVAALRAAGGHVRPAGDAPAARPDVVVDGIVGIGGRPGLRPAAEDALARLAGAPVVAVDVPSGVDVDTGELPGPHVTADLTVTFGTHRVAHLVDPAAEACGEVRLVPLTADGQGLDLEQAYAEALDADDVARLLPRPGPHAHKYTRGVVGVRAGSARYPGAALLCVAGAMTGLVGMVRFAGDERVASAVRARYPEVVGPGRVQAWAVGPGTDDAAGAALQEALSDGVPVLVDADALGHVTKPARGPVVLTPHAGELSRMLGVERSVVEARPLEHVQAAAVSYRSVVLLKGRRTLVAGPDGAVRVTTDSTAWLGTAGAGDVLSGLVAALMAAGLAPYDAASVGSWLHAAAALRAGAGGPLRAGDVADAVPLVVRDLVGAVPGPTRGE